MPKTVEIFRADDSQRQLQDAQRQQMLAQAMMAQGQSPDDMFSQWNRMPIVPRYSTTQGLTQLASSLMGAYNQKKADEKVSNVQANEKAAQEKAQAEAMARMLETTKTDPRGTGAGPNEQTVAGVPTDRPKTHGELLADAMAAAKAGVPEPVIKAYLEANAPYTLNEGDTRFVGNQPVASSPKQDKPYDELSKLQADLEAGRIDLKGYMARRELLTTRAPSTQVTVNTGEKYEGEFAKQLAQSDAAQITEYRKTAEASRNMVKTIGALEKRNPTALSGGGAQTRAQVANWLAGWTGVNVVDPEVLKDTQVYNAILSKAVLDAMGGSMGAGVSNADVQFINNTVPKLEDSKEARKDLMDYLRGRASENIDIYNRAREYGEKTGGLKGFESYPIEGETPPKAQKLTRNLDGSYTYTP